MFLLEEVKIIGEWILKGLKRKRFISQHLPLSLEKMDKSAWMQIKEDIDEELEEHYANYDFMSFEQQNLVHRFSQMRRRLEEKNLNETDIKLIHYLYGKESLDNITYNVKGQIDFYLKEPYFSFLKTRVTEHFFMKYYVEMMEKHTLKIKGWQRKKDELLDILLFISKYGEITNSTLTFPAEEYGFEKIVIENKELIAIQLNHEKQKIEKPTDAFLLNLQIPQDEKRMLHLKNGVSIPLMKEFMKPDYDREVEKYKENEKNVELENGEKVTACSQCIFRIRQMSGGCKECKPSILYKQK
jgi:hypothetical protein